MNDPMSFTEVDGQAFAVEGEEIRRLGQHEPGSEQHGLFLRWDSTYSTFRLHDTRAKKGKRIVDLGEIGNAVLVLQEEYGLTSREAEQVIGRAAQGFNAPINVDWARRVAEKKPRDEGGRNIAVQASCELGKNATAIADEAIMVEASKVHQKSAEIADLMGNGLTTLRNRLATLEPEARVEIGQQMVGLRRLLAGVHELLGEGLEASGDPVALEVRGEYFHPKCYEELGMHFKMANRQREHSAPTLSFRTATGEPCAFCGGLT